MLASQPYHLSGPKEQRLLRTDRHVMKNCRVCNRSVEGIESEARNTFKLSKELVTTFALLLKLISLSI